MGSAPIPSHATHGFTRVHPAAGSLACWPPRPLWAVLALLLLLLALSPGSAGCIGRYCYPPPYCGCRYDTPPCDVLFTELQAEVAQPSVRQGDRVAAWERAERASAPDARCRSRRSSPCARPDRHRRCRTAAPRSWLARHLAPCPRRRRPSFSATKRTASRTIKQPQVGSATARGPLSLWPQAGRSAGSTLTSNKRLGSR